MATLEPRVSNVNLRRLKPALAILVAFASLLFGADAHLANRDASSRYTSLDGLKNIVRNEACSLPPDWKAKDVDPQISRCKLWWDQEAQFRDWN
jgi:hypothetical protein